MTHEEAKNRAADAQAKVMLDIYREAYAEKEQEHRVAMFKLREDLVKSIARDVFLVINKVGMSPLFISRQEMHRVFVEKYGLSKHENFEQ